MSSVSSPTFSSSFVRCPRRLLILLVTLCFLLLSFHDVSAQLLSFDACSASSDCLPPRNCLVFDPTMTRVLPTTGICPNPPSMTRKCFCIPSEVTYTFLTCTSSSSCVAGEHCARLPGVGFTAICISCTSSLNRIAVDVTLSCTPGPNVQPSEGPDEDEEDESDMEATESNFPSPSPPKAVTTDVGQTGILTPLLSSGLPTIAVSPPITTAMPTPEVSMALVPEYSHSVEPDVDPGEDAGVDTSQDPAESYFDADATPTSSSGPVLEADNEPEATEYANMTPADGMSPYPSLEMDAPVTPTNAPASDDNDAVVTGMSMPPHASSDMDMDMDMDMTPSASVSVMADQPSGTAPTAPYVPEATATVMPTEEPTDSDSGNDMGGFPSTVPTDNMNRDMESSDGPMITGAADETDSATSTTTSPETSVVTSEQATDDEGGDSDFDRDIDPTVEVEPSASVPFVAVPSASPSVLFSVSVSGSPAAASVSMQPSPTSSPSTSVSVQMSSSTSMMPSVSMMPTVSMSASASPTVVGSSPAASTSSSISTPTDAEASIVPDDDTTADRDGSGTSTSATNESDDSDSDSAMTPEMTASPSSTIPSPDGAGDDAADDADDADELVSPVPDAPGAVGTGSDSESSFDVATSFEPDEEICIDARLLTHLPESQLVYGAQHRRAFVLCDNAGSCATAGHMVLYDGMAMSMKSYCDGLVKQNGNCVRRVVHVNSPKYQKGMRVPSRTDRLEFTAHAARFASGLEELVLQTIVNMGL